MREWERIARIQEKILRIWKRYPDWRLGQLLVNVTGNTGDMFFLEDDRLELQLDLFLTSIGLDKF